MTDTNSVTVIGRIVRDSEYGVSFKETPYARFSIAVKRGKNKDTETSYFDVVLFNDAARVLGPLLLKGKLVCVNGSLRQERWDDCGKTVSRVKIVGTAVQILDGSYKKSGDGE
jgi:single-strand DNA-binding protein